MFAIAKAALSLAQKSQLCPKLSAAFHIIAGGEPPLRITQTQIQERPFLTPNSTSIVQNCGFKVKGRVRRRCKDCFLVWREQRLYNICKTHPRHKQMSLVKDEKTTWLLTHATQGKVRPW